MGRTTTGCAVVPLVGGRRFGLGRCFPEVCFPLVVVRCWNKVNECGMNPHQLNAW